MTFKDSSSKYHSYINFLPPKTEEDWHFNINFGSTNNAENIAHTVEFLEKKITENYIKEELSLQTKEQMFRLLFRQFYSI